MFESIDVRRYSPTSDTDCNPQSGSRSLPTTFGFTENNEAHSLQDVQDLTSTVAKREENDRMQSAMPALSLYAEGQRDLDACNPVMSPATVRPLQETQGYQQALLPPCTVEVIDGDDDTISDGKAEPARRDDDDDEEDDFMRYRAAIYAIDACRAPAGSDWREALRQTHQPRRYTFGTELAIAAIIASVGISKVRYDQLVAAEEASGQSGYHAEQRGDWLCFGLAPSPLPSHFSRDTGAESVDRSTASWTTNLAANLSRRHGLEVNIDDTLQSIAEKNLGDSGLAWLVADINACRVKEYSIDGKRIVELRCGQSIELPSQNEVALFYRTRRSQCGSDNLVTIVTDNNINRQLLQAELASLVAPAD